MCVCAGRVDLQFLFQMSNRFAALALLQKDCRRIVMNFGTTRINLERLLEMSESAIEISFADKGDAEIVVRVQEIRLDFQFLLELNNRLIEPSIIHKQGDLDGALAHFRRRSRLI